MPYLHVTMPTLFTDVREFTAVFEQSVPQWSPVIHISEHPYDNIGVEGALLSDTYEECARKSFYYEMSE